MKHDRRIATLCNTFNMASDRPDVVKLTKKHQAILDQSEKVHAILARERDPQKRTEIRKLLARADAELIRLRRQVNDALLQPGRAS